MISLFPLNKESKEKKVMKHVQARQNIANITYTNLAYRNIVASPELINLYT